MTQRQPRLVEFVCKQASCEQKAKSVYQGNVLCEQRQMVTQFKACGGGVSVVSLIGNVGVCEAAWQCGGG
jgi:hypothetical protein